MKLLLLITGLVYGGAETQFVRCAVRLKERGWNVRIVTLMSPKAYVEELKRVGISVTSLGIQRKLPDPRPFIRLIRIIRSWWPVIVHSYMVHASILARIVRPLAHAPVLICSARNVNEGGRFRELLYRFTDPLCDLTTQVSRAGLERYVKIRAVPRHKVRFIPNGVDMERFHPDETVRKKLKEQLGLGSAFTWLAVGRFDEQKDYPNMLRALSLVAKERPNTVLLIAGDGPLRPIMEKLTQKLSLKENVRFLGIRRDIPDFMNAADVYVMSSAWEGMANVLLEASATELPIVATDVGGNREVVIDGETGFLVPPKDSETLAKAMLRLMELPEEERRCIGEAARQYIKETYDLDRIVDRWEALYRELLARKGLL